MYKHIGPYLFAVAMILTLFGRPLPAQQATYTLKATPKTVAWGYYDAKAAPVLRAKSGDTVEIQTLITNGPKQPEDAGVPPEQVEQSLRDITDQAKDKGVRMMIPKAICFSAAKNSSHKYRWIGRITSSGAKAHCFLAFDVGAKAPTP